MSKHCNLTAQGNEKHNAHSPMVKSGHLLTSDLKFDQSPEQNKIKWGPPNHY